ncbi:hypothetical protein jhhlp_008385 [Lomentospora prolificans]|uniref:Uncharacterized protein n=1 Tax=Lomentospora prolificans TaxID=41688 RepID=A0A2N3MXV7_9PEZI|nr:hypothetical protein jhhlp_008385 [Lomentospora prolificans]
MARLRNIIQSQLLSEKPQNHITPGPDLPWESVGPGKDHLLAEVEKLYWRGARDEIEHIINTVAHWRDASFSSSTAKTPKVPTDLQGYDSFLENVNQWSRESAEKYSEDCDQVDHLILKRDKSHLDMASYRASTANVLRQKKTQFMMSKMKKEIKKEMKRFLDIDKVIEHRPAARSANKRPAIPQLAVSKFDKVGMPQFQIQRCTQPGCNLPIVSSHFTSNQANEPRIVCETCYRLHHYGKDSYTKTYKHFVCNEVITPERVDKICRCSDVKRVDKDGKPVSIYPINRLDLHINSADSGVSCGIFRLNELEACAKYDGLLTVSGAPNSKLAEIVSKMSITGGSSSRMPQEVPTPDPGVYITGIRDDGKRSGALLQKMRHSLLARKDQAEMDMDMKPGSSETSEGLRAIKDPGADKNVPVFLRRFADTNGFGNVHMALRVGTVIFEIGVAHSKHGALVTIREPPVFQDATQDPSSTRPSLVIDGIAKAVWKQNRPVGPRKRYKVIMKQVVGASFMECPEEGLERDIIKSIVAAAQAKADERRSTEKHSALDSIMAMFRDLVSSWIHAYMKSIVALLLDPRTNLTWSPDRNSCQHFCNSILDTNLFGPLLYGGSGDNDSPSQLYTMSFVCADEGYEQRVVKSKHDVPPGLVEEYLSNFYFGRYDESDFIDSCQEYWHDWSGTGLVSTKYGDLFPYDCTRAYLGDKYDAALNCGRCELSRHLWASPFDSWAMLSLHLMRGPFMYPPNPITNESRNPRGGPQGWMKNRLMILHASSVLSRVAFAMAKSPTTRASTTWLSTESALLENNPTLARVRMGGIHRAQPFSHYYEKGANKLYFVADWATTLEAHEKYLSMRHNRAKSAEILRQPIAPSFHEATGKENSARRLADPYYSGFGGSTTVEAIRKREAQRDLQSQYNLSNHANVMVMSFVLLGDPGTNDQGTGAGLCGSCPVSCGAGCGTSSCGGPACGGGDSSGGGGGCSSGGGDGGGGSSGGGGGCGGGGGGGCGGGC